MSKRLTRGPDGNWTLKTRPATVREAQGNLGYLAFKLRQISEADARREQRLADLRAELEVTLGDAEAAARRKRMDRS